MDRNETNPEVEARIGRLTFALIVLAATFVAKCFWDREELDDMWADVNAPARTIPVNGLVDERIMIPILELEQEVDMLKLRVSGLEGALGLEDGALKWGEIKRVECTNSVCD